jgi:hypothetical protein
MVTNAKGSPTVDATQKEKEHCNIVDSRDRMPGAREEVLLAPSASSKIVYSPGFLPLLSSSLRI